MVKASLQALHQHDPVARALLRYEQIARRRSGEEQVRAGAGLEWVRQLAADLKSPTLGTFGIQPVHVAKIVEKATQASSMKANPIALDPEEPGEILKAAI